MFELIVLGTPLARLDTATLLLRPRRLLTLTYLALEGVTDRASLASVFWDNLDSDTARSRLRLELHRIAHSPLGAYLKVDGERLHLSVECDAARLLEAHAAGQAQQVVSLYRGELLSTLSADTPALQGWLEMRREELARHVCSALEQLAAAADASGDSEAALTHERRLLELSPYSPVHAQRVMRRLQILGRWQEERTLGQQFRARVQSELSVLSALEAAHVPELPAAAPRPPVLPSGLTNPPLVGREGLWQQLEAWEHSQARALLLSGEAGVGKSRLVAEWSQRSGAGAQVVQGVELAQGVPFYALGEWVHRPEAARLQDLAPVWQTELAALWPDVFPGVAGGRAFNSLRLLEALSEALRLMATGTGLIVVEDLHWLDSSSLQVLGHALRRWGSQPDRPRLLMTARPAELNAQPQTGSWLHELERGGALLRLGVSPLSEVAVLRLIRLLSGSPRATGFARRLHALSGGNPYALLAFLQGLQDQGLLTVTQGGQWSLEVTLETLEQHLTPTLSETLCSALERHGTSLLRWMDAAALLAPPFEFGAAQAGSGLPEDAALTALELAAAHRWIVPTQAGVYRFGHDLLRHALQQQQRPERAAALHRRLARHLEEQAQPQVAQLAHHLEAAGERERAYPRWREAAANAAQHWAHREALVFLERGLACTADLLQRLEVHRQRCFHHNSLNDLKAWDAELDAMHSLLTAQGAALGEGQAPEQLAYVRQRTHFLWRSDRLQEALDFSEEWEGGELSDERALLVHDRGLLLKLLGRLEEAVDLLRLTLGRLGPDRKKLAANLHNALAQMAVESKQISLGRVHVEQAIELFGELAIKAGSASAYSCQAALYELSGQPQEQLEALQTALGHASEAKVIHLQKLLLELLCEAVEKSADWEPGLRYATQGLELCEELLDEDEAPIFRGWIQRFRAVRAPHPA
ncbi:ATP-binding protein [Deinococcus sp.]|uniref:ATP-binding protein n=1 Tax=Deinococcus sp. TaxID=47478 RepID=UPI003CC68D36